MPLKRQRPLPVLKRKPRVILGVALPSRSAPLLVGLGIGGWKGNRKEYRDERIHKQVELIFETIFGA